jgi:hypothetical protein
MGYRGEEAEKGQVECDRLATRGIDVSKMWLNEVMAELMEAHTLFEKELGEI